MGFIDTLLFREPARRDWVFIGFVGLTVLACSWTGASRFRYGRAASRFGQCVADGDADCAAPHLEALRSMAPEAKRTTLADAEMAVLGGDGASASAMLARAVGVSFVRNDDPQPLARLEPEERGAALLVAGDIAALRGDATRANARWTEAAGVVDDALIAPRRRRFANQQLERDAKLSADMLALKADFDRLFDNARNGSDTTADEARALRARVESLQPRLAAVKLAWATTTAERCAKLVRTGADPSMNARRTAWPEPQPPVRPSEEVLRKSPGRRADYDRAQKSYEQAVTRWQAHQVDADQQRASTENDASRKANGVLDDARAARDEGLALASTVQQ